MARRNGTRLCGKFPTPRPIRGIWGGSDSVDDDESLTISVLSGELAASLFIGEMISDPPTGVIDDKSAPRNSIADARAHFIIMCVFAEIKRFFEMELTHEKRLNEMHLCSLEHDKYGTGYQLSLIGLILLVSVTLY